MHGVTHNAFRDALIIIAAIRGGARTLFSEDLTAGQVIEGVQIKNPFQKYETYGLQAAMVHPHLANTDG